MKRAKAKRFRISTTIDTNERRLLKVVRGYVKGYTGINTTAEALRFLIRNWMP